MDNINYGNLIKYLTIIPILVGILTFVEIVLPYKTIETEVLSKREEYRAKTESTTYTINFKGINDQFNEGIYKQLNRGDKVSLKATYFNRQIRELVKHPEGETFINDTLEPYALYAFAFVFLLTVLLWFKKGEIDKGLLIVSAAVILFSLIQLLRMLLA